MQEFSEPALATVPDTATTTDAPVRRAAEEPGRPVLRRLAAGGWTPVAAADFHAEVLRLARGLAGAGVAPGDRVALLSRTRHEWTVLDYAIWYAGAVSVPVYPTAAAVQIESVVRGSGAVAGIGESAADRGRLAAAGVAAGRVWSIEDGGLDALAALGRDVPDSEIEARRTSRRASDVATIVYTSGTTGAMKGCALTHRNLLALARNTIAAIPEVFAEPGGSTLLCLPLAHSFTRFIQVTAVEAGLAVGHLAEPDALMAQLPAFQPTFLPAVPRMLRKIFDGAVRIAAAEGREEPFRQAAAIAAEYSRALSSPEGPADTLKAKHAMMDALIYGRLRAAVGGARFAVSGAAPLGEQLAHFYRGIGIPVLEGYGLTETTAPVAANVPSRLRPGTVGRAVPGCALRLAADGEILVRGPVVFAGYWNDEAATKEVLDEDGWLHTGDLGTLDEEGYLTVTGRIKDLLVTASGKNVAPEPLEEAVAAHPLVGRCVVVGEGRPFVAALVTLDAEALRAQGIEAADPRTDPGVLGAVEQAVAAANATVSHAEAIKRFRILEGEFTEERGQLTPSLKTRRAAVLRDYAAEVDALYAAP